MEGSYCVIADIVGSREIFDRSAAQKRLLNVLRVVSGTEDALVPPLIAPWATFGDEFQFVYRTLADAIRATTLISLELVEGPKLRFGIGYGGVVDTLPMPIGIGEPQSVLDGDGWICARTAIEAAQHGAKKRKYLLSAYRASSKFRGLEPSTELEMANSHLGMRDFVISKMAPREARICSLTIQGKTQAAIAKLESVSQPSVSQSLQRSGGYALMELFAK